MQSFQITFHRKLTGLLVLGGLLVTTACSPDAEHPSSQTATVLPMEVLSLENLEAFQQPGANWQIAGDVESDYETEHSLIAEEGAGILVNLPSENSASNLQTSLEHGDMEMEIEVMIPKNSNSGIYFQSRYELQIIDSWKKEQAEASDLGGIYERWDETRPEGEEGYEGYAPSVNAALAPGLWQKFHILFRAPRFDENGNKVQNAMFEEVYLNGVLIHENVELSGPTRGALSEDETELAPILIQGDHGPVAFRNFRYKTFSDNYSLNLGPLEYTVYDFEGVRLPDFDTLSVVLAEGVTDSFNVSELSPKNEYFAIWFSGELEVPVSGDYLFQTQISNGGDLYIDGERVIANDGEIDSNLYGNIVTLEEGTHSLEMSYFQRTWNMDLLFFYEGPGMERQTLGSELPSYNSGNRNRLTVRPGPDEPELIGGFTHFGDEKRTHTLSVGTPEGVHYSYDLYHGAFLKFWRGPFADVTQMWQGRGSEQLLEPMNAAVENKTGIAVARVNGDNLEPYEDVPAQLVNQEYLLDESGLPVFKFEIDGIAIEDRIFPGEGTSDLTRIIRFASDAGTDHAVAKLAEGTEIKELANGLYRIDGNYYLEVPETAETAVFNNEDTQVLAVPVLRNENQTDIRYRIIW